MPHYEAGSGRESSDSVRPASNFSNLLEFAPRVCGWIAAPDAPVLGVASEAGVFVSRRQ